MKKNGFTLIELVIVIAILAILAIIIIPKVMPVKESASMTVNSNNAKALQGELEHYKAKNDLYPIGSISALRTKLVNTASGVIYLERLPRYKNGTEMVNSYTCSTGETYSITFNDDTSTSIKESDNSIYIMSEGTDADVLFK